MPRIVATVAVATVSHSDARSSPSDARLATPRAPPADTRPTTGARMNNKNNDASIATRIVTTERVMAFESRFPVMPREAKDLLRESSSYLRRCARADDDRAVEHVDVRGA